MKNIGTCGHEIEEEKTIAIKDFDRDGSRVIFYLTLCEKCINLYRDISIELKTKQEERRWLDG